MECHLFTELQCKICFSYKITSLKESMVSVLISNLIINLKSQVHKGISQDIESLSNH